MSQSRIDRPHEELRDNLAAGSVVSGAPGLAEKLISSAEEGYLSIILFDEIEKAHPIVWNALLGILEDGMLTLGDNSTTDFTCSLILMTSNVGSRELAELVNHRPVGFSQNSPGSEHAGISLRDLALQAAQAMFPFEFLNRFDEILTYAALEESHLDLIFDKFLAAIHSRAMDQAGIPLLVKVSNPAKKFIIEKGTDLRFGARPLRRAMESLLVDPLSRLIASGLIQGGDVVEIDLESDQLAFYRRDRSAARIVA